MSIFNILIKSPDEDDVIYSIPEDIKNLKIFDIHGGAKLVIDSSHELIVCFALLSFSAKVGNTCYYELIWHGSGPSGGLRELRHSYFGEDGYLYYAPMRAVATATEILEKYFDF